MVYFVADATASWSTVRRCFIDCAVDDPFLDLPYADLASVELRAPEKEHRYCVGHGYRVKQPEMAYKAQWLTSNASYRITDIASIRGQVIVSEAFKALVECFEPNVHQFIPVDIYGKPEDEPYARHYFMNVCNRTDSTDALSMERHGWFWKSDYAGGRSHWLYKGEGKRPPIVFNLDQIAKRHLWVDTYLTPFTNFYASDAFVAAARSEAMTGLMIAQHQTAGFPEQPGDVYCYSPPTKKNAGASQSIASDTTATSNGSSHSASRASAQLGVNEWIAELRELYRLIQIFPFYQHKTRSELCKQLTALVKLDLSDAEIDWRTPKSHFEQLIRKVAESRAAPSINGALDPAHVNELHDRWVALAREKNFDLGPRPTSLFAINLAYALKFGGHVVQDRWVRVKPYQSA